MHKSSVIDGHTESVFVETSEDIDPSKAKEFYNSYNQSISVEGLPSPKKEYYAFHEDPTRSQPRMERSVGDGMTTTIAELRKKSCSIRLSTCCSHITRKWDL